MPRGDKSSYSNKQKRQAEHIEDGYENRGVPAKEAERRAWATVNKETGGGKKSGSGRGKAMNTAPSKKGGRIGGKRSHTGSRTRKTAAKSTVPVKRAKPAAKRKVAAAAKKTSAKRASAPKAPASASKSKSKGKSKGLAASLLSYLPSF